MALSRQNTFRLIAGVTAIIMLVGAGLLVAGEYYGPGPEPIAYSRPHAPAGRAAGEVSVAGSGTNLPLTRALADAFNERLGREAVVVHDSIGSSGAVLAVYDGAVDLGLLSRPLNERDQALGMRTVHYSAVPVVLAANRTVTTESLTMEQILSLYSGDTTAWEDGSPAVVLQREQGDSAHRAVAEQIPEFATIDEESRELGRFSVYYSDQEMQDALLQTPGGVGWFDLGAIRSGHLPLHVIEIAEYPREQGRYPFVKPLSFLTDGELRPLAQEFVDFVLSPEGAAIISDQGYLP
ncbi:MAG: substrate-binding domain-containing protein [Myxococcales bacterium]|nr:substrate-binding domain-containing protein [Myxococcales bacterium]